jgi:membrane-associated phospholipid phosphatase
VKATQESATEWNGNDRPRGWLKNPIVAAAVVVVGGAATTIAFLVGVGLVTIHLLAHTVGSWDDHVNRAFARHRTPTDNTITADFTLLANTMGIVAVAAVVAAIAAIRHHLRLAIALVIALGVELAGFLLTNIIVARPRPHVPHVGSTPSTFSWPSGHVAATFVLYGGIAVMVTIVTRRLAPRMVAWALPAIVVPGVALSRVYRGDHHPTDTVAGLVLGIAALGIGFAAVRASSRTSAAGRRSAHRWAQSPPAPAVAVSGRAETSHAQVGAGQGRSA